MTDRTPEELRAQPAWWEQYRKAVVAAAVGLLATLTDLAASYADGDLSGQDGLHASIVFVSTILSTVGVATVSNVYPAAVLRRRLDAAPDANARLRAVLDDPPDRRLLRDDDPPGRHEIGGTGRSDAHPEDDAGGEW
jgi:hypothetical protein